MAVFRFNTGPSYIHGLAAEEIYQAAIAMGLAARHMDVDVSATNDLTTPYGMLSLGVTGSHRIDSFTPHVLICLHLCVLTGCLGCQASVIGLKLGAP